jgi:putative heme transporter
MLRITLCLGLARRRGGEPQLGDGGERGDHARRALVKASARMIGEAVGEACRLVRLRDPRLAGAIAYWAFDAAVVWAMLRAFGSPPVLPVIALAYFIGQVANTLPIPGSVSGG